MAKKKVTKKEIVEDLKPVETEIIETESKIDTDIEPIDINQISEEIEEMKEEIFEKEEPTVIVEEKKEVKNKLSHKLSDMFGFVWNGQEYD